jgi:D-alanyl-D-alanine dipeptidase
MMFVNARTKLQQLISLLLIAGFSLVSSGGWVRIAASPIVWQEGARTKPADAPVRWKGLLGEYIGGDDTLCVLEQQGRLFVLPKSGELFQLNPGSADTYVLGSDWPHSKKECIFRRNPQATGISVEISGTFYRRLFFGVENGKSFRIRPLKPVDVLRDDALKSTPPKEEGEFLHPDLVELTDLDSTIHLDIRYATTNNFVGERFYSQAKAFLQRPAAQALVRAHQALRRIGYGLLIYDAYRPWYVTKMFWDATPMEQKEFVADPAKGSRHNRGCAADLSLYDLKTGQPVDMVSGYDEFSHRAYPEYPGGTSLQRWHRNLLRQVMEVEGFRVFEWEWWHFDYKDWRQYPIGTLTFETIHR